MSTMTPKAAGGRVVPLPSNSCISLLFLFFTYTHTSTQHVKRDVAPLKSHLAFPEVNKSKHFLRAKQQKKRRRKKNTCCALSSHERKTNNSQKQSFHAYSFTTSLQGNVKRAWHRTSPTRTSFLHQRRHTRKQKQKKVVHTRRVNKQTKKAKTTTPSRQEAHTKTHTHTHHIKRKSNVPLLLYPKRLPGRRDGARYSAFGAAPPRADVRSMSFAVCSTCCRNESASVIGAMFSSRLQLGRSFQ